MKTRPSNCFVDSKGEGHIKKIMKRKAICVQCDFLMLTKICEVVDNFRCLI